MYIYFLIRPEKVIEALKVFLWGVLFQGLQTLELEVGEISGPLIWFPAYLIWK